MCIGNEGLHSSEDPVESALNHPAGILADAALIRLWNCKPKANNGLPSPVRAYFDTITASRDGHLGRVMIMARLHQLYSIDPEWTEKHLLPLLTPTESKEAQDLWSGFAWSPTVGPNLLSAFKEIYLDAIATYKGPEHRERNLVNLFISICLDAPNQLTAHEIRRTVNSLPEEGLEASLRALARRLTGNPCERAEVWELKIRPWLEAYWPKAAVRNTSTTANAMLGLLVECGDAFPNAVTWSESYLQPIDGLGLYGLKKSDHVAHHPEAVFQVLKRVVQEQSIKSWEKGTLREILDALKGADPALGPDPAFQDMYRIATS